VGLEGVVDSENFCFIVTCLTRLTLFPDFTPAFQSKYGNSMRFLLIDIGNTLVFAWACYFPVNVNLLGIKLNFSAVQVRPALMWFLANPPIWFDQYQIEKHNRLMVSIPQVFELNSIFLWMQSPPVAIEEIQRSIVMGMPDAGFGKQNLILGILMSLNMA
jgi:hypothetical protein